MKTYTAKTVEDAIKLATEELGIETTFTVDNVPWLT